MKVRTQAPGLMFDFVCRAGVCGSCGMMTNGRPTLVYPLPFSTSLGDLSVDTGVWFRQIAEQVESWIHTQKEFNPEAEEERMDNDLVNKIYGSERCIECGCCIAGCAIALVDPDFLGAAGLFRIGRFMIDPRDPREDTVWFELVSTDEGMFERMGSNKTIEIDVRIIAPTHKNLEDMIAKGTFRDDLYYRLDVVPIMIPPLKERAGDIEILTDYFLEKFAVDFKVTKKTMSDNALLRLNQHSFPGNVRELKNLNERLYILTDTDLISVVDIAPFVSQTPVLGDHGNFKAAKKEFEIRYLTSRLERHNWNVSAVAKELGMQQPNLSRKIKQLGIKKD